MSKNERQIGKNEQKIIDAGYEDVGIFPDFDSALIGVDEGNHAVYDYDLMVKVLMDRDGMTYEEADEYLIFNTCQAYFGEQTPVILHRLQGWGIDPCCDCELKMSLEDDGR